MSVIYVLLAISITVAVVFFIAFVFSVKSGQYDDTYTPSVRMLFEDEVVRNKDKSNSNKKEIKQTKSTNQ
ncbi:cbb3-type cytochrome oxidase assembly protein CcoS [Flagellimonas sp.]|uniref:cbb3-type cytochrome oxidase assembly protein CcoS n=1 Tax=Flagellimonas sp. TaxID=2058762 RepID=UPI003BACD792